MSPLVQLLKELLHLAINKVLNLLRQSLDLGCKLGAALVHRLAGMLKDLLKLSLSRELNADSLFLGWLLSLVGTLGDDVRVIGGTSTVPGENLVRGLVMVRCKCGKSAELTLLVSLGTSVRAPSVAMEIRFALSFLGVISATA